PHPLDTPSKRRRVAGGWRWGVMWPPGRFFRWMRGQAERASKDDRPSRCGMTAQHCIGRADIEDNDDNNQKSQQRTTKNNKNYSKSGVVASGDDVAGAGGLRGVGTG
ncbi:unnamed protein product, partial [Discosporangium mesarthrocarpum]